MADENKISIDISIDSQNQINQSIKAFDNLRNSINSLSQPFNSFSNNLNDLDKNLSKYTDSLTKLSTQNQEFVSTSGNAVTKVSELSTTFTAWDSILKFLNITIKGWTVALTGGLAIVTAFLPEIINFASALFKGKDAINAMASNFKNLNDVMKTSNTEAASQITRFQVLYKSATDVNNTYADRIKSVRELKKEFPDHLKGLRDEDILNGNAKKTYKELTQSIIDTAKAKAALSKITDEENKLLDADYQIEKIKTANQNEIKRAKSDFAKQPTPYRGGRSDSNLKIDINKSNDRAQKALQEQEQLKTALQANIDFLMKFAGGANAIAKSITNNNESENHSFTNTENANKTLNHNSAKELQSTADKLTKQAAIAKKYHEAELIDFKDQLAKKQITQAEYDEVNKQQQDKYHEDIKAAIKTFNDQDLAQTLQHQKDLVEAEQLSKDQQNIDKAILPANKLAAEQQLITDKYNFEIQKAAESGKDTAEIRERYQQEITTATKKHEQQRKDFELQTTQQVSNAAFSILQNSIKSKSGSQVKQLETQKQAELSNSSLTASQKQAIEDKYKKKEAEVKVKAFKDEQKASILQAVINGALAITKTTAQTGAFAAFVIPGIIAETAIQVATIAAQKPPQYAKGGLHYQSDGKGALLSGYSRTDNTNAYLRSGEAVVVSEAMRNPWARNLVSAINVAHGGRDFSITNPGRGYAIGGIFTDGGNSNRYYNQPMNDQKDLANTIAYQMINNFPPVYVDVKDINSQQNILAQTVNRVNL
ncbi:hypothetical protein [Mucilaginibacter sp.]|uniref:hypothetical protein n=1 Tax=Mucilaginibacter sp. TaxID=1882438 RepID=UPI00260D15CC|nr:hypothetical protein [Mucilaginibacter sp.]MDB5030534.1 smc 2 [Mucilaginibacter sp.]